MKRLAVVSIIAILLITCVVQQACLFRLRDQLRPKTPAPITNDIKILAKSLHYPKGAKNTNRDLKDGWDSRQLGGASLIPTGFDGCLWLDISGIKFSCDENEIIVEIAACYAEQIAALIPGAFIEFATGSPVTEANTLHATYVVKHPDGCIIISAGYKGNKASVTDRVKVEVRSTNHRQGKGICSIPAGHKLPLADN